MKWKRRFPPALKKCPVEGTAVDLHVDSGTVEVLRYFKDFARLNLP